MGFDPNISRDDAPSEIEAFENLEEGENYAPEFEALIELLGERFPSIQEELEQLESGLNSLNNTVGTSTDSVARLVEADGNTAVAVPEYDSLSDSEMQALADATNSDEVAMVVIDGEAGILED